MSTESTVVDGSASPIETAVVRGGLRSGGGCAGGIGGCEVSILGILDGGGGSVVFVSSFGDTVAGLLIFLGGLDWGEGFLDCCACVCCCCCCCCCDDCCDSFCC